MAWGDLAKVGKLLSSLSSLSAGSGKWSKAQKGGGKGIGGKNGKGDTSYKAKSVGKGNANGGGASFGCLWEGCWAAEQQSHTWGGKCECHGCGRPKATAVCPPVESMVDWAYRALLAEQTNAAAPKGKGKGKGKPRRRKTSRLQWRRCGCKKNGQSG